MRTVALVAAACTVAALGAVPASAATKPKPKPVCNLITDDAGDAKVVLNPNVPSDDSVDILGADFASNAKTITAVIKVKAFTNPNPQSPLGQAYYFSWMASGSPDTLTLSAGVYPTGIEYKYGYEATANSVTTSYSLGDARGSISGNVIRISADIAKFPQAKFLAAGHKASALDANARHVYGQRAVPSQQVGPERVPFGGVTLTFDDAAGKSYVMGTPSCVAVGK